MGTLNIIDWCAENGNPLPTWAEQAGSVFVTFAPVITESLPVAPRVSTKLALSRHQVEILHKCHEDSALVDLMAITGRSDRTKFRQQVLHPLLEDGLIEMTIPDKPRSSKQRYRLTDKGRSIVEDAKVQSYRIRCRIDAG
jgi:predicted transcriptional regulator